MMTDNIGSCYQAWLSNDDYFAAISTTRMFAGAWDANRRQWRLLLKQWVEGCQDGHKVSSYNAYRILQALSRLPRFEACSQWRRLLEAE